MKKDFLALDYRIAVIAAICIMCACILIILISIIFYLKIKNYASPKTTTDEQKWIDMHRIASEYVEVKEIQVKRLDTFYPLTFNEISYYLNNCES